MQNNIQITMPDGSIKEFPINISGLEIAKSISTSLAKIALAIKVGEEWWDLSRPINKDAKILIITPKNIEALEIIRHDSAHILAQAVKELYPETQVTIGPAIEDGFYYDFARDTPFALEDLEIIEKRMFEISKRDEKIIREVWQRNEAIKFFEDQGEKYKAEIIASIPKDQDVTLYRQGNFIDLCRGPHAPSTSHIKYFKLTKLAGAYWRGDSKNQMLQRIYGTAFESKESLDNHLKMLEEAEKRNHRKLGRELDLFHLQDEAVGAVFWHKNGYIIYREIEKYLRYQLEKNGYDEIKTPQIIDRVLWEKSGHWDKFHDNMFIIKDEEKILAVKPMSCPGHIQIFNQQLKSYRQLPLRFSEFGCCHRNESSGSLSGIMRVRAFTQDDAHIFCEEHQINSETAKFCELLKEVYHDFGFDKIKVKISTRPEIRAGDDQTWDKAENALIKAVEFAGLDYEISPGEGAFYGPKLEFHLTDALGRSWQCGTLQVDYIMPQRLEATYIASDGSKKCPVMLHRAIIGTFERFIGILIENYAGKFPLWLSPVQMVVATITNDFDDYAAQVVTKLKDQGFRVDADLNSEKINYKIREHSLKKVPYILVVGKKEAESNSVSVRKLGQENQQIVSIEEFINIAKNQVKNKE
jgi:threonyl-tRNA synthetase